LSEGHPIHAWRTRIGAGKRIGTQKDVRTADLVVENVEAESGLRLRLAVQLSLKAPDLIGKRCGGDGAGFELTIEAAADPAAKPLGW
jgi:hypothetical protein